MINPRIKRLKDEIDELFKLTNSLAPDDEAKPHLVNYIVIRVSGFLERSTELIFNDYVDKNASLQMQNYFRADQRKFNNLDVGKIIGFAGSFSDVWKESIKSKTTTELRESMSSFSKIRNNIAHGAPSSVVLKDLQSYYNHVITVIDLLEEHCK